MTIDEQPGLRERKKRESARAIEVAAVELATEHPLAEVTVEAISRRADVTSRTFFNYFASKEDAVLGSSRMFPPPSFDDLQVRPGQSVLDAVFEAVRGVVAAFDDGDRAFQAKKRAVVLANPHLLAKDFQALTALESGIATNVARALATRAADHRGPALATDAANPTPADATDQPAADDEAWAIVMFTGAVLRLAMHRWSHDPPGSARPLLAHIDEARALLHDLH